MDANNSPPEAPQAGQEAFCHIMPDSECEEIVYMLAKTRGYKSLKSAIGILCPTCSQNLRKLLTRADNAQVLDQEKRKFKADHSKAMF